MAASHEPLGPAELKALAAAMREAGISEFTTASGATIKLGPAPVGEQPKRDVVPEDMARLHEKYLYAAGTGCRIPPPR